jgi:asparagine synthase (glutamine-hydrolysing)
VTVALSGDGGDELFGGYLRYSDLQKFLINDHIPNILKKGCKRVSEILPKGYPGKGRLWQMGMYSNERYLRSISQFSPELIEELLHDSPLEEHLPIMIPSISNHRDKKEFITSFMEFDFKHYLPHDILTKVDKASMMNSLEVRAPLLDYRIVEHAARIPFKYKINNNRVHKYILKKAFADILPSEISAERKQGFDAPLKYWFNSEAIDYMRSTILSRNSFSLKYFNQAVVNNIIEDGLSHSRPRPLWNLLFLEHWYKNYMNSDNVAKNSIG